MRLFINIGVLLTACFSVQHTLADRVEQDYKIIHAGWLLADARKAPRENMSIIIKDNQIKNVVTGFVKSSQYGSSPELIDLKDKFVLPGLIDNHVHLQMGNLNKKNRLLLNDAELALHGAHSAGLTLAAGVTTVRDVGAVNKSIFDLKKAVEQGLIAGPRIYAAGSAISITGGHGVAFCDGADNCRQVTRKQIADGADVIKFAATAGGDGHFQDAPEMYPDEMAAVIDSAHRLNRKVAAHAHSIAGIKLAIKSGVDSIEHGSFIDDEAAKMMAEKGVFLVPTLMVRDNLVRDLNKVPASIKAKMERILNATEQVMGTAIKHKVKFAMGSDTGVVKHGDNTRELEWLVSVGMTPQQAIEAATFNSAELLGVEKALGTIESGKLADIIAVNSNPLKDIKALKNVSFVMKDGVVYQCHQLCRL